MSQISSQSAPEALPRRSSTLFVKPAQSMRRLVRRLSLSGLRKDAPGRPDSAASVGRSSSRLGFGLGRRGTEASIILPTPLPETPGPRSETASVELSKLKIPAARVVGKKRDYDAMPIVEGRRVSELWFPGGDTLVYLCSKEDAARYEPAFKLSSATLRRKSEFFATALSTRWQRVGETVLQALLEKEKAEYVLYFPPWEEAEEDPRRRVGSEGEMVQLCQQLLATRNLFAYLFGRPFVALMEADEGNLLMDFMERLEMYILTPARPSARKQIIAELTTYITAHSIDDPRNNPRRLLNILLLSTRYTIPELFTESFIHAAGLYPHLTPHPLYPLLPAELRQLLELSHLSIVARVTTTTSLLSNLKFPGLDLTPPRRRTRKRNDSSRLTPLDIPRGWSRAFNSMREMTLQYYTHLFRLPSWPPKRWTRGMMLQMYTDFSSLLYLLSSPPTAPAALEADAFAKLLQGVLQRYEDAQPSRRRALLPRLPDLPQPGSAQWNKKLSREQAALVLAESYDLVPVPRESEGFVERFKRMEREYGAGRTVTKSCEAREGRWCFIYVVWRALGDVVGEEWRGLRYGWGVEEFLSVGEVERNRAQGMLERWGVGVYEGEEEGEGEEEEGEEKGRRERRGTVGTLGSMVTMRTLGSMPSEVATPAETPGEETVVGSVFGPG